jgi:hypothetical protein
MNTATIITTEIRIIGMSCSHCEHAAGYDTEWPS